MAPGTVVISCALVPVAGFQAVIAPASDEKRKNAGDPLTGKPEPPLNTTPVGAPSGMLTTSGTIDGSGLALVAPRYSVETSVPLSEIQAGLVELNASPHGFTRLGS